MAALPAPTIPPPRGPLPHFLFPVSCPLSPVLSLSLSGQGFAARHHFRDAPERAHPLLLTVT